jgi:seryl-tRNA synthetase
VLVREEAMYGTGFFPTDRAQIYETTDGDALVGTSEVPLAAMHMEEILESEALPLRYAGYSTCFRREAGAAGRDTRGILRLHQFDKLEMFSFCRARAVGLRARADPLGRGGHPAAARDPYRVVNIAAGDLGAPAAQKFDCEAWLPGQQRYRELTSCSNCTDYQARRLNCRYRTEKGPRFVHTLNGTGIAIGRTLIAIMENHQRADGTRRSRTPAPRCPMPACCCARRATHPPPTRCWPPRTRACAAWSDSSRSTSPSTTCSTERRVLLGRCTKADPGVGA